MKKIILLSLIISYGFSWNYFKNNTIEEYKNLYVNKLKEKLPLKIDKNTFFTNIKKEKNNIIMIVKIKLDKEIKYTFLYKKTLKILKNLKEEQFLNKVCYPTYLGIENKLINKGITFKTIFKNYDNNKEYFKIIINKNICNNFKKYKEI